MVGSIGTQNVSLSLATLSQSALKSREGKDKKDAFDTLADFLKKVAPEQVDSWQQQLEDSKRALSQLQAGRSDINEQRKAAAQQKVDQIKARIQMLRMMAAINPEAAAKLAKQLARELSAAVKEYAAAGGGGAGGVSVPTATAAPAADAAAGTGGQAAAAGLNAGGVTTAVTAGMQGDGAGGQSSSHPQGSPAGQAAATDAPSPSTQGGEGETPLAAVADPAEESQASQPGHVDTPQEKREKERKAIQSQAGEAASSITGPGYDGDNQFVTDVRWLKDLLNSIVQTAKRQIDLEKSPNSRRDIRDAEAALRETEKALGGITGTIAAGIGAVNILV